MNPATTIDGAVGTALTVTAGPPPVATQVRAAVERASLCEALDRLLTTGVVVVADATLTVANIDLLRLQLQLVLSSAAEPPSLS
jgi:Gas vesicle protein